MIESQRTHRTFQPQVFKSSSRRFGVLEDKSQSSCFTFLTKAGQTYLTGRTICKIPMNERNTISSRRTTSFQVPTRSLAHLLTLINSWIQYTSNDSFIFTHYSYMLHKEHTEAEDGMFYSSIFLLQIFQFVRIF